MPDCELEDSGEGVRGSRTHDGAARWLLLSSSRLEFNLPQCIEDATAGDECSGRRKIFRMEVLTAKVARRSTRVRVEIPVSVISLDRRRPFGDRCTLLVVSAQGCGFRASEELPIGTPVMLSGLPGGGSVTGQVANCLPLGNDGKYFLIGASLHTHGNVWGIENPPEDWKEAGKSDPPTGTATKPAAPAATAKPAPQKKAWPYNLVADGAELHSKHR